MALTCLWNDTNMTGDEQCEQFSQSCVTFGYTEMESDTTGSPAIACNLHWPSHWNARERHAALMFLSSAKEAIISLQRLFSRVCGYAMSNTHPVPQHCSSMIPSGPRSSKRIVCFRGKIKLVHETSISRDFRIFLGGVEQGVKTDVCVRKQNQHPKWGGKKLHVSIHVCVVLSDCQSTAIFLTTSED